MTNLLKKTIQFVDESFGAKDPHYERALYWLLKLDPEASEALRIAAYSHDVKRAFKIGHDGGCFKLEEKALIDHQIGGGEIMRKFLIEKGADSELAENVNHLISRHEWGGDDGQNLVKDADSLSYFEVNAMKHLKANRFTDDEKRAKFDFMYKRITSPEAKKIARPMYDKVIQMLNDKIIKST